MDRALVVVAATSADLRERAHGASVEAALQERYEVTIIDLVAEGITPAMSRTERAAYHTDDPIQDPTLAGHARLVMGAAALVFVFPTEWWTPPAVLQAWVERVFVPGVSFVLDRRHRVAPNLTRLTALGGVTTHRRPEAIARGGDGARRMLVRTIRLNAPRRVRTAWVTDPKRDVILARIGRL